MYVCICYICKDHKLCVVFYYLREQNTAITRLYTQVYNVRDKIKK